MRKTEFRGYFGEFVAMLLLLCKGYRILKHRYKLSGGEIDIVAKRGNKISFIEVKTRKSEEKCQIAITPRQLRRIRNTSQFFLKNNPKYLHCDLSYDVIFVVDWHLPQHIENISI
ncbi:MAG: YraN family protein [Alphaproteobacteria bacterium]|nr:YraN family protein [Alphaproteobacteria bacterium]